MEDASIFEYLVGQPVLVLCLTALGLLVGFLTGLFGVGGAFIATPVMITLLGIDSTMAVGSSLGFTIGTSAIGFFKHLRQGNVELKSTLSIGIGAAIGVVFGFFLHLWIARITGDSFDTWMTLMFVVLLIGVAIVIARAPDENESKTALLGRIHLPPYITLTKLNVRISVTGLVLAGIMIGLLKGTFGLGGGVILLPVLILIVGLKPHAAVGTSLGAVFLSSIVGCLLYGLFEQSVNLGIVAALMIGSIIGTILGAKVCCSMKERRLQKSFSLVVGTAAVLLLCNFLWTFTSAADTPAARNADKAPIVMPASFSKVQ